MRKLGTLYHHLSTKRGASLQAFEFRSAITLITIHNFILFCTGLMKPANYYTDKPYLNTHCDDEMFMTV